MHSHSENEAGYRAAMIDQEIEDATHRLLRIAHRASADKDLKRLEQIRRAVDTLETHYRAALSDARGESAPLTHYFPKSDLNQSG